MTDHRPRRLNLRQRAGATARWSLGLLLLLGVITCSKDSPTQETPQGTLAVAPAFVGFTATVGAGNPPSQTFDVTGTGEPLSGLRIATIRYGSQGSGWLQATLQAPTAPTTVTLQPVITGLAAGTYTATVPVAATNADNDPQSAVVTLEILPQPVIGLSNTSVGFLATPGGANPPSQVVAITNQGGATLAGLSSSISYTQGASGWLQAALSGAAAPATLTLQANTAGLPSGTYAATVSLTATNASNTPQAVSVTLQVSTLPLIGLSLATANLSATEGGANPAPYSVSVSNAGGGTLTGLALGTIAYPVGTGGWLQASLSGAAAPATLTLVATTAGLSPGNYTATVPVQAPGVSNSPRTVTVALVVTMTPPSLVLSQTALTFAATQGGPLPPSQMTVITSGGSTALGGVARGINLGNGPPGWFAAALTGTVTPATMTVQPLTTALTPGTYTGSVSISAPGAGNSPQAATVTYVVSPPPPIIALSADSLLINAMDGGATPATQAITISNAGPGSLNDLALGAVTEAPLPGWLGLSLSGNTAPATLTVQADQTGLTRRIYTGIVPIISATAGNGVDTLVVQLAVIGSPVSAPYTQIAPGYFYSCALVTGGAAYCWGNNEYGELGTGSTSVAELIPQAVTGGLSFSVLATNENNFATCGLDLAGAAYCWGDNRFGGLGDGTTVQRSAPVPVVGGHVFQRLAVGFNHACGLEASGAAWCWGYNYAGQLGDGTQTDRLTPTAVTGGLTFTRIEAGYGLTCGVTAPGAAYCWGDNATGSLGDGSNTSRSSPTPVSGGLQFAQLAVSHNHTCGLTAAGAAYCWGDNQTGQFGNGTQVSSNVPVSAATGLALGSITTSENTTCGVSTAGAPSCWGLNGYGELGDGYMLNRRILPGPVVGGLSFTAIKLGGYFACGVILSPAGSAYCWGSNDFGQLGSGIVGWPVPTPVVAP